MVVMALALPESIAALAERRNVFAALVLPRNEQLQGPPAAGPRRRLVTGACGYLIRPTATPARSA